MNKNTPTQYLQSGEKYTVPLVPSFPLSQALFYAVRSCCRSAVLFVQPVPSAARSVTRACLHAGKGASLENWGGHACGRGKSIWSCIKLRQQLKVLGVF